MKTGLVIQARMTSKRLPGKVLKTVLGKTLLAYLVERVRRIEGVDAMIVATSEGASDDVIVEACDRLAVSVYRGSEQDVLSRYAGASLQYGLDTVLRITADCPLADPGVVEGLLAFYKENQTSYDYVSNTLRRTYPVGLDAEVFSGNVLDQAAKEAKEPFEREHVTPFIWNRPDRFRLRNICLETDLSRYRWTVDTQKDFELIEKILTEIYPKNPEFNYQDVLSLLEQHPDWTQINAHIKQRSYLDVEETRS